MWFLKNRNTSNVKRTVRDNLRYISFDELIRIVYLAYIDVDCDHIEYEVPFKFNNGMHKIGMTYDKNSAPADGVVHTNYISFYVDDQVFKTITELRFNAELQGVKLLDVHMLSFGVTPEYYQILQYGEFNYD